MLAPSQNKHSAYNHVQVQRPSEWQPKQCSTPIMDATVRALRGWIAMSRAEHLAMMEKRTMQDKIKHCDSRYLTAKQPQPRFAIPRYAWDRTTVTSGSLVSKVITISASRVILTQPSHQPSSYCRSTASPAMQPRLLIRDDACLSHEPPCLTREASARLCRNLANLAFGDTPTTLAAQQRVRGEGYSIPTNIALVNGYLCAVIVDSRPQLVLILLVLLLDI